MVASSPTPETARTEFLNKVSELVDFWDKEARVHNRTERLEGLAYSILSLIGGTTDAVYKLTPGDAVEMDIGEGIHDHWGEMRYGLREAA